MGIPLGILVPLFLMDPMKWTAPDRKARVSFWDNAFLAGLFAFIVTSAFDGVFEAEGY